MAIWYREWIYRLSCVQKQLLYSRQKGLPLSVERLYKVRLELLPLENSHYSNMLSILCPLDLVFILRRGKKVFHLPFNPNSAIHMRQAVDALGIAYDINPKTNNPVLDKSWLSKQTHQFCRELKDFRRIQKVRRDFCDTLLSQQHLLPAHKKGFVYPEFKIFGAETGRFSCSNPNIQQIPDRDPYLGGLIKSCFLAFPGETFGSLDYCQQEFRQFSHYCFVTGIDKSLKEAYDKDPNKDYHDIVAEMLSVARPFAKTINLGSLYGMGKIKQSRSLMALGLSTLVAQQMYDRYHNTFPSVKQLSRSCADVLKTRGYIRTLLGRRSRLERPYTDPETGDVFTFEYQGISKLIQGSSADQMIDCLTKAWECDILIMFSVHDAVKFSSSRATAHQTAKDLAAIMNTCTPQLIVPMRVKAEIGPSWGELEELHIDQ